MRFRQSGCRSFEAFVECGGRAAHDDSKTFCRPEWHQIIHADPQNVYGRPILIGDIRITGRLVNPAPFSLFKIEVAELLLDESQRICEHR